MDYKDRKIFFAGRAQSVSNSELEKYLVQNGAIMHEDIDSADIIIEGNFAMALEDKIYDLSLNGTKVIDIQTLEQEFSKELDIDTILMAIKISKDQERLINLLLNRYFSNEQFIKFLKFYDWQDDGLYDNDQNRDVSSAIVARFCSLTQQNHNIEHSPIGIYYTALETNEPKLLELIYQMPDFAISDKNAKDSQPLSLKEVVALNPNTPKPLQMQILKNGNIDELKFLSINPSVSVMIKDKLTELDNEKIIELMIKNGELNDTLFERYIDDKRYRDDILRNIKLDSELFAKLMQKELSDVELIYLSSNDSLDSSMVEELFKKDIENIKINLLKSANISFKKIEEYMNKKDKIYNITIAHNEALMEKHFESLAQLNDLDVDITLAGNKNTPSKILEGLFTKSDFMINLALSTNTATPINILMQLQLDNRLHTNVSDNETYREFSKKTIGIIT